MDGALGHERRPLPQAEGLLEAGHLMMNAGAAAQCEGRSELHFRPQPTATPSCRTIRGAVDARARRDGESRAGRPRAARTPTPASCRRHSSLSSRPAAQTGRRPSRQIAMLPLRLRASLEGERARANSNEIGPPRDVTAALPAIQVAAGRVHIGVSGSLQAPGDDAGRHE